MEFSNVIEEVESDTIKACQLVLKKYFSIEKF
jgi:hypothetical protein